MKNLLKSLLGWCLAMLGWAVSLLFRLADWCLERDVKQAKKAAVAVPAKVATPDRYNQAQAQEWGERMQWQEMVEEDIDELVPLVREDDNRG